MRTIKKACKNCGEVLYLKGGYCGKVKCIDAKGEIHRPNKNSDLPDKVDQSQYQYFYSLVRPKPERKKRRCLRCRKEFIACKVGADNNRICGECHQITDNVGFLATVTPVNLREVLREAY